MTNTTFQEQLQNAECLFAQGHHQEALQAFLHLNSLYPDSSEVSNNLGVAYYTLGDLEQATYWLEQAVNLSPNFQDAQNNLHAVRVAQKKDKQHHKHHIKQASKKIKSAKELSKQIDTFLNISPKSVIDVGCGYGYFLHEAKQLWSINKAIGIDGPWIEKEHLQIPQKEFLEYDLQDATLIKKCQFSHNFDLAVSFEVAEHLDKSFAKNFVEFLTSLSDIIIFSAAIPGQGGQGHVNEQWPSFWVNIFKRYNYKPFDILRERIWHNQYIEIWLRQNILLFAKEDSYLYNDLQSQKLSNYIDIVHPEFFLLKLNGISGLRSHYK